MKKILFGLPVCLLMACGNDDKKSEDSSSSAGNLEIELKSSQLALLVPSLAASSCTVQVDANTQQGICSTPLAVKGAFSSARLANSFGGKPIRLLGGGTSVGPTNIFKHTDFDLAVTPSIPGEDNIQDGTAGQTYNHLAIQAQFVEFAFSATPAAKVYHVRTFFVNNVPSTEAAFSASSCRLASALAEADSLGTLFEGVTALAGDIMVCVKASAAVTCEDADYQWVDSTGTLVSTRPASPKKQSGAGLITASACPSDGADWGYAGFNLAFDAPISVTAAFNEGTKIYTANATSGEKLIFEVDVDLEGSVFVPASTGVTDLALVNEAAVLNNIDQIMLKSLYVSKNRQGASSGELSSMLQAVPKLVIE